MPTFKEFMSFNEGALESDFEHTYDMDYVDGAIARYVIDPKRIWEVIDVEEEALERYSNDKPVTLYRGLNFESEDEYDSFMSNIKNGKIKLDRLSSWSPDKEEATSFAEKRKANLEFVLPGDPILKMLDQRAKHKERITGYRGVVLETRIPKGKAIDLDKCPYKAEKEMILTKGTYSVKLTEIMTYKDQFKNSTPNEIVETMDKKNFEKIFNWLRANKEPEDLSDESREKIFKLAINSGRTGNLNPYKLNFAIEKKKNNTFTRNDGTLTIYANVYPLIDKDYIRWCDSPALEKYREKLKPALIKAAKAVYDKYYETGDKISWSFDLTFWSNFANCAHEIDNIRSKQMSKEYKALTDKKNIDRINKLSGNDKKEAMLNYQKELMRLIGSIN